MAAITGLGAATWTTAAGNKTVTATPAVNDLIVVVAGTSGLAGGTTAVTDDNSSGTYTQVDSDRTGFSTTGVLTVWVRTALISSAASTIFTAAQAGSSGGGLKVYAVSGMSLTGASAVRSNGGESSGTAGNIPAPVLNQAALTTNPVITAVCNTSGAVSPPTSPAYTWDVDVNYASPTTGLDIGIIDSGETRTTITWAATSASTFASFAIELDSSVPVTNPPPFLAKRMNVVYLA